MKDAARVPAIAVFSVLVFALTFQARQFAQNGPPSDGPGQGDIHRTDPCEKAPDPHGNANGIEKRCALGASSGVTKGDFNGDGFADLAVGVPDETRQTTHFDPATFTLTVTDHPDAGAVDVFYGSATGVTTTGRQVLDQGLLNASDNTHLGRALAAGNFRGPGFASDLAVGVPGAIHNGARVGAINVFFSASGKLNREPNQLIFADQFTGAGTVLGNFTLKFPEDMSMTWGDFNGDSVGDLAVEANTCSSCASPRSAVLVIYGAAGTGLNVSNTVVLVVDDGLSPNNPGTITPCADQFNGIGRFCATSRGKIVLSAGDLNADGKHDLLIGAPNCNAVRDDGTRAGSGFEGCVIIVRGKTGKLEQFGGWNVLLPRAGIDARGGFGLAMAVGDFDSDAKKDVAVGAPNSDLIVPDNAGTVRVYFGVNPSGGSGSEASSVFLSQILTQNDAGMNDTAEANDRFGAALAANDFNLDGATDLAIGAPGESSGNATGNGVVHVISGLAGVGLSTAASTGHPAAARFTGNLTGEAFGSNMSAWNFGKTAAADLAIAAPFRNAQFIDDAGHLVVVSGAGAVNLLYGFTPTGLGLGGSQAFSQGQDAKAGNHFGASVY